VYYITAVLALWGLIADHSSYFNLSHAVVMVSSSFNFRDDR